MTREVEDDIARLWCDINCGGRPWTERRPFTLALNPIQRLALRVFRLAGWARREVDHAAAIGALIALEQLCGHKATLRYWNTRHREYQAMTEEEFEAWYAETYCTAK